MKEIKILLGDNMQEYQKLKEDIADNPLLRLKYMVEGKYFHQEFIVNNDNEIRYYRADYNLTFSSSVVPYLKKIRSGSFSFNKITNKVQFVRLDSHEMKKAIKKVNEFLGTEWFSNYTNYGNYRGIQESLFYTKTILEKVWGKKITNPEDLIKFYSKNNLQLKNISWKNLRDFLNKYCSGYVVQQLPFIRLADIWVNNPDLFISKINILKTTNPTKVGDYRDYVYQIASLKIKSNVALWSDKRFDEEHTKLSLKLMELELNNKDATLIFSDLFNSYLPKELNCKFINNEQDCFKEGKLMHNCIYTNYWNRIKSLKYFAISIDDKVYGRATAGIYLSRTNKSFEIEQIKGKRNTVCSTELYNLISKWLAENQDLFKQIISTNFEVTTLKDVESDPFMPDFGF